MSDIYIVVRKFSALAATVALLSCADIDPSHPYIAGQRDLISVSDINAILVAVKRRQAEEKHQLIPVYRIQIISTNEVRAFYGIHYGALQSPDNSEYMIVERRNRMWKVTEIAQLMTLS